MKRILLCGFLMVGLASCRTGEPAATPSPGQTASKRSPARAPQLNLSDRARQYWQARVDRDWAALYDFLEPWQQDSGTRDEYIAWAQESEPFNVLAYNILDVQEQGPYGWVRLTYDSTLKVYPGAPPRTSKVDQKWTVRNGSWFPIPATQSDAFPISPTLRDLDAEKSLARRFEQTWQARKVGDFKRLYEFADPRDKENVPFGEFEDSEGLFDYMSHDLKWVEVVGDKGKVRVVYTHTVTDPSLSKLPPRDAEITEQWTKVNNEWYRDLKW